MHQENKKKELNQNLKRKTSNNQQRKAEDQQQQQGFQIYGQQQYKNQLPKTNQLNKFQNIQQDQNVLANILQVDKGGRLLQNQTDENLEQQFNDANMQKEEELQLQIHQQKQVNYRNPEKFNNIQFEQQEKTQIQKSNQNNTNKLSGQFLKIKKKQTQLSKSSNKSKSNELLMCIQDSQIIPPVYLQSSPKGQKFINIKILMYKTTTFMKMQTQVFILDVRKPGGLREYQVERRYSDFVQLYQALFYNQPGYILAPFPDKGIQTFIKIKLGIGTNQPGQRCQMIEKRMADLQKFINFVTHHPELSNSEELVNFITQDKEVYQEGKARLQKYVRENKGLQKSSQIKNLIGMSKSFINSYIKGQQKFKRASQSIMSIGKNDIQFGIIIQTVKTQKAKLIQQQNNFSLLQKSQKAFGEFTDLPTQNDLLLKVCAKHTSAKNFCKNFSNFIEIQVLDQYTYNIKRLQQVQKILQYRLEIWQGLQQAKKQGNIDKKQKLYRRLQLLQRNFLRDWDNVFVQTEKNIKNVYQQFVKQWQNHKINMRKIWKPFKLN